MFTLGWEENLVTIFYPDVSKWQKGIDLLGAIAVCAKVTEGTTIYDPCYATHKANAESHGALFFNYHFLRHGSPTAQANWCYQHAGSTPLMLDWEPRPSAGSYPTVYDAWKFIDVFRSLGGVVWLLYHPNWYWQQLGSPSLQPFIDRGMKLVSSNYTTYSDSGPGWVAYGGMAPAIWQYSSTTPFNGYEVDFNAFKGALAELKSVVQTGKIPAANVWYWHAVGEYFTLNGVRKAHTSGYVTIAGARYYWHASPTSGVPYFTLNGKGAKPPSGVAAWG